MFHALLVITAVLGVLLRPCVLPVLIVLILEVFQSKIAPLVPQDFIAALLVWALYLVNVVAKVIIAPEMSASQTHLSSFAQKVPSVLLVLLLPQHASPEGSTSWRSVHRSVTCAPQDLVARPQDFLQSSALLVTPVREASFQLLALLVHSQIKLD
jgi:hypothetical protein